MYETTLNMLHATLEDLLDTIQVNAVPSADSLLASADGGPRGDWEVFLREAEEAEPADVADLS